MMADWIPIFIPPQVKIFERIFGKNKTQTHVKNWEILFGNFFRIQFQTHGFFLSIPCPCPWSLPSYALFSHNFFLTCLLSVKSESNRKSWLSNSMVECSPAPSGAQNF